MLLAWGMFAGMIVTQPQAAKNLRIEVVYAEWNQNDDCGPGKPPQKYSKLCELSFDLVVGGKPRSIHARSDRYEMRSRAFATAGRHPI